MKLKLYLASIRLTHSLLIDHTTNYNLQAYAKHLHGCDWRYHRDIPLINSICSKLRLLGGILPVDKSFDGWVNGDVYEFCGEQQGLVAFPGMSAVQQLVIC